MNLKELKQLKTIKAIRHDKNFVSTDDFIKDIESKILKENYQILSKDKRHAIKNFKRNYRKYKGVKYPYAD